MTDREFGFILKIAELGLAYRAPITTQPNKSITTPPASTPTPAPTQPSGTNERRPYKIRDPETFNKYYDLYTGRNRPAQPQPAQPQPPPKRNAAKVMENIFNRNQVHNGMEDERPSGSRPGGEFGQVLRELNGGNSRQEDYSIGPQFRLNSRSPASSERSPGIPGEGFNSVLREPSIMEAGRRGAVERAKARWYGRTQGPTRTKEMDFPGGFTLRRTLDTNGNVIGRSSNASRIDPQLRLNSRSSALYGEPSRNGEFGQVLRELNGMEAGRWMGSHGGATDTQPPPQRNNSWQNPNARYERGIKLTDRQWAYKQKFGDNWHDWYEANQGHRLVKKTPSSNGLTSPLPTDLTPEEKDWYQRLAASYANAGLTYTPDFSPLPDWPGRTGRTK